MISSSLVRAAVCSIAVALGAATALAQAGERGSGPGMMEPGMMGRGGMGPGMMMGRGMGMMGGCPMMGMMGGGMHAYPEGRIAFLKAELGITDQQKAAWDAYAETMRKNLANMQSMHQSMSESMKAQGPVARLETHIVAMEGRLAALKEAKAPLSALYAALSDEQKKKADDLITGMGCMM